MTRRLRRGTGCLGVSVVEPKECSGRAKSPLLIATHGNFAVRESLAGGTDAPTPARTDGAAAPRRAVLSFDAKESTKESTRHGTTEAARPAARNSQISAFRALPCPALVFAQACQSLTAYGSCAHWARAPSRPKLRSAGAEWLVDPNLFGSSNSGLRAGTV